MPAAEGFRYDVRPQADVVIFHHGRMATTLRGKRAEELMVDLAAGDAQAVMARVTGNDKHGNESAAATHPRNCH